MITVQATVIDVPENAWYYLYVCRAIQLGAIQGYSDRTFKPSQTINVAEAAKIITKVLGLNTEKSDPWFKIFITELAGLHALPLDLASVDALLTRGQMAEILYRIYADIQPKASHTYESLMHEKESSSMSSSPTSVTSPSSVTHLTELPLGDGKYSASAKKGYVFSCQQSFSANAPGAFNAGDWITTSSWNPSLKPMVDGSVNWSNASFSLVLEGSKRIVKGNGLPVSAITGTYPIQSTDDAYQYDRNPNSVQVQTITFELPSNPTLASSPACTSMGMIGIATNGVAIFNAFDAGGRDAPAHEILDACDGHPQQEGMYHYHDLSRCLESQKSSANHSPLLGYALDGFGMYGQHGENGALLHTDDLDECHGHTHTIEWDSKNLEMYHYHMTEDFPYTLSCFRGTPTNSSTNTMNRSPTNSQRQGGMMSPPSTGSMGSMPNNPMDNQSGQMPGPPQAAMSACSSKATGEACSFRDTRGTHLGLCTTLPEGNIIACKPSDAPSR